eukprot:2560023-Ditylum_brightwellii.AAC.1
MAGTIVYTDTHTLSEAELNACPHIDLTSPHPWDQANINFNRNTHSLEEEVSRICQGTKVTEEDVPPLTMLKRSTDLGDTDMPSMQTYQSTDWHTDVSPEDLSKQWHIN